MQQRLLLPLALVYLSSVCLAQQASGSTQDEHHGYCTDHGFKPKNCVVYNHPTHSFIGSPSLELGNGDLFALLILNTAPQHFTYPLSGVEQPVSTDGQEAGARYSEARTKVITVHHEKRFGGYEFEILSPDNAPVSGMGGLPTLAPTVEPQLIVVKTAGWNQSLAGAFTGSSLTDPEFSVYSRTAEDGTEMSFVDEDLGAEDDASLSLGAFLHLHHSSWDLSRGRGGWALSFGLGLDSEEDVSYYLGPSWRFGDKGALTAGVVVGPVVRLPSGVRVCSRAAAECADSLVVDPNVLGQLSSRNDIGGFIGLSYSFLDVSDLIQKPFKKLTTPAPATTTPTQRTSDDQNPVTNKDPDGKDQDAGGPPEAQAEGDGQGDGEGDGT